MRLCKGFIIKDILDYESLEDINIFEELQALNVGVVLDLIKIGNNCTEEEADEIFSDNVEKYGLAEVVIELFKEIVGREPDENSDTVDKNSFSSFSDLLGQFFNEMQTVDEKLSITEFWSMNTKFMYEYADGIQQRYIFNKNKEMQSQYNNVAMFMSALSGKLKECPQFNEDGTLHKKSNIEKLKELKNK